MRWCEVTNTDDENAHDTTQLLASGFCKAGQYYKALA
jgi:hypothetical protein